MLVTPTRGAAVAPGGRGPATDRLSTGSTRASGGICCSPGAGSRPPPQVPLGVVLAGASPVGSLGRRSSRTGDDCGSHPWRCCSSSSDSVDGSPVDSRRALHVPPGQVRQGSEGLLKFNVAAAVLRQDLVGVRVEASLDFVELVGLLPGRRDPRGSDREPVQPAEAVSPAVGAGVLGLGMEVVAAQELSIGGDLDEVDRPRPPSYCPIVGCTRVFRLTRPTAGGRGGSGRRPASASCG